MTSSHATARRVVPAWPDRPIAELAARQQTMVSRRQLLALGIRPRTIDEAIARGRLFRVHRGVYSLVPAGARPPLAAEWAALLAGGPQAFLSHRTAGRLHDLAVAHTRRAPVELTIVGHHRDRRRGIAVHRARALDPADVVRVHRLPVTSVARTTLDLAPTLADPALEQLVDRALKRTSRTKLRDATARRAGRPGAARVAALLDPTRPSAEARSRTERRLREMLISAGLPSPEGNMPVGPYTVDLGWRRQRVIVEYDSDLHAGDVARRRDDTRHNDLTSWGWQVLHVPWLVLRDHPERVVAWVAVALARAEWTVAR